MMKKFLLFMLGVLGVLPGIARDFSYEYEGQTLTYTVLDENAKTCMPKEGYLSADDYIFPGNDVSGVLVIPSVAKDGDVQYSVRKIGEYSFSSCSELTSVTIPNSVRTIGYEAFSWCSGLTSVTIPNSVIEIGEGAFAVCGLTSVTIPNSVTEIGKRAFWWCNRLTSVTTTSANPPIVADDSFEGLHATTVLSVPENAINEYLATAWALFENIRCGDVIYGSYETDNLKYRLIPAPAQSTEIKNLAMVIPGNYSFLTQVTIPERISVSDNGKTERYYVDAIGYKAFNGCKYLKTVNFNSRSACRLIYPYAFNDCTSLEDITIPASVKTIGDYAFNGASQLSKITFNEGLESIGEWAFSGIGNTQPIYIPSTLKSVGTSAFDGSHCEYVDISDLESWCNIDFRSSSNPVNGSSLYLNGELIENLVIPESVKAVKDYAFYGDTALKSVTFHDDIQSIGSYAFYSCDELGRDSNSPIVIPGSVTAIGDGAFSSRNLLDLGYQAVVFEYSPEPIKIASNAFLEIGVLSWDRPIKSMNLTTKYLNALTIGNSVTEIPANLFGYSTNLESLTLGNSLTTIGYRAFWGCNALTEVVLPPSVETIGWSAFCRNINLSSIIMGPNVKSIGGFAFDDCPAKTVSITAQTPPAADNNTFSNYTGSLYVQGQKAVEDYYDTDFCWFQFDGHAMIEPTELKVEGGKTLTGKPGDTFQLTATLYPEDVTLPQVFWRSTNPDIASVDVNGRVTLHADMSEVKALAEGDDETARSCKIIAESLYADGPVAEITVNAIFSGIDEIVTDEEVSAEIDFTAPVEVYNLQGVMVARTTDNLATGFYIVRQGKNVKKIAVK